MGSCCSGLCATGRTLGACPMCVGFVCGCVGWWVSVRVESIEVASKTQSRKRRGQRLQPFFPRPSVHTHASRSCAFGARGVNASSSLHLARSPTKALGALPPCPPFVSVLKTTREGGCNSHTPHTPSPAHHT